MEEGRIANTIRVAHMVLCLDPEMRHGSPEREHFRITPPHNLGLQSLVLLPVVHEGGPFSNCEHRDIAYVNCDIRRMMS